MTDMTPRDILDTIREGLEESALLTAVGYDATQGRPGRELLNNALERRGYGRPVPDRSSRENEPYLPYPDEWIHLIASAVTGRPNTALPEIIATLKRPR